VAGAVFFGASAMKNHSFKITCWGWLYRHTRHLRWLVASTWPVQSFPLRLTIELELRSCERIWKLP